MRYDIIGLGLIIFLTSCATTTTNYYTKTIGTWRGGNANTLVKTWGMPDDKVVGANGNTVYVYKTSSYNPSLGPSPGPTVGVNISASGRPVMITDPNTNQWSRDMSISCVTAFAVNQQGIITDIQSRGNHCYGSESFANQMKNPAS
ncbi:MAG: hypothetical protein EPO11_06430 [Gammaproteobacteria bacterium]|nr:MAG: hypothetical protein EPO11_06430 [Gammaproteobacteria bacterium]